MASRSSRVDGAPAARRSARQSYSHSVIQPFDMAVIQYYCLQVPRVTLEWQSGARGYAVVRSCRGLVPCCSHARLKNSSDFQPICSQHFPTCNAQNTLKGNHGFDDKPLTVS